MSRGFLTAKVFLIALLTESCGRSLPQVGTTFSDSAGVILAVAEAPAWDWEENWRLSDAPVLEIGAVDGPQEFTFSDVVGVVRLRDGRIVVADRDFANLRFYSPAGEFLSSSRREGKGPGEFQNLQDLKVFPGDSLVTFDTGTQRIQIFDSFGVLHGSMQVTSPWPEFIPDELIGVLDANRIAMKFVGVDTEQSAGVSRWPPEMAVVLDISTGSSDSITVVPGDEALVTPYEDGGFSYYRLPFRKENDFAAGLGKLAVISNEVIAAHVFSVDGRLERIMRHTCPPRPVTQQDVDEFVEDIVQSWYPEGSAASVEEVTSFRRYLRERPWGDTWPFLDAVEFDAEGNLWLEQYAHVGDPAAPYYVFSSTGAWLGEVTLPPHRDACYQIGEDFVLGVWVDEMDAQYVRMYALEKG